MARRNIVDRYSRATVDKRVEIILDNYATFNRILDGYEKSPSIVTGQLSALLKEEYDFYLPYINKEKNYFEIAEDVVKDVYTLDFL